jgi:hypothetical protein
VVKRTKRTRSSFASNSVVSATTLRVIDEWLDHADLPHLRDGGRWRERFHRERAQYYLHELLKHGMGLSDALILVADIYWDCALEMKGKEL